MSLEVDESRYFLYHHTPADTVDKLNPMDMALGVAAVGVMSYVIADMPGRLGPIEKNPGCEPALSLRSVLRAHAQRPELPHPRTRLRNPIYRST